MAGVLLRSAPFRWAPTGDRASSIADPARGAASRVTIRWGEYESAPIIAVSLRYDPPNWGKSRPFFEIGTALSPYIDATYTRYYTNGLTPARGSGRRSIGRSRSSDA